MTSDPKTMSVEHILFDLIELPPDEQTKWLDQSELSESKKNYIKRILNQHVEDQTKDDFLDDLLFTTQTNANSVTEDSSSFRLEDKQGLGNEIGPYQIEKQIGEGGMGKVFLAVHKKLEKKFAIKLLPKLETRSKSEISRFEREVKIAGKLDHPNLVASSDAGVVNGHQYLVMEFVDGPSLQQILDRNGRLSTEQACEISLQAVKGIQHAHEMNLVHRDIKPSNIMIQSKGSVKVVDFGLAALHHIGSSITGSHQILGTLDYMAPEQAGNQSEVGPASDIYSLGATLYKLLSGKTPLQKDQPQNVIEKVTSLSQEPFVPIESRIEGLPIDLQNMINLMLDKDPSNRPTVEQIHPILEKHSADYDLRQLIADRHDDSNLNSTLAKTVDSDNPEVTPIVTPAKIPKQNQAKRTKGTSIAVIGSLLVILVVIGSLLWSGLGRSNVKIRTNPEAIFLSCQSTYKEVMEPNSETLWNLFHLCEKLKLPPENNFVHVVYEGYRNAGQIDKSIPVEIRIQINQRLDLKPEQIQKAAKDLGLESVSIRELLEHKVAYLPKKANSTDQHDSELWVELITYCDNNFSIDRLGFPTESFAIDESVSSLRETHSEISIRIE